MRFPTSLALLTVPLLLATSGCFAGEQAAEGSSSDRVKIAMLQPPRFGLTPFSDDAFKLSRWATAETLVTLDADGNALPGLATDWTRTSDTAWELTVREGVKFHDGSDLTADAVVNTLTRAGKASPKPRILDGVQLTAQAAGNKVTVTTATPDPLVPQRLSSPQLAILAPGAYAEDGKVNPVGTGSGPFVLVKVGGTSTATLDRFDGYWGERAKAAGLDVSFVPDGTARAASVRTGEAHIAETVPVSQAALLDPALLTEVPMPRTNTLYLNTRGGPMADPAARAAVRAAVDAEEIVKGVYEGRADVAKGLLGPALPWTVGEREPLADRTAPGAANGASITIGTFTDRAELPEVASIVQQRLEDAGFTVKQDVREYAHIEQDALAGKFDVFILSRATVLDSGDPVAYLRSDFTCGGSFNISGLCDPAVDAAVQAAEGAEAGPERRAAILAAEAAVLRTDAGVPLLHERVIQADAANVVDSAKDPRERALVTSATHIR
ncbi:ABC transporter substrate-binding protein [Actinosynnema pretiosum subsp. pretiosum]|uniref:Extracellular solute-binding protein family 5 n=2 Tax=Actinosynnema TaxID=40566 RepID=C6WQR3_ACTMD|nr:ABC transporter substrate-binding protein [Actinosynnema mirum]ACU38753.1 extracellular solute-binding protein family 5 [Actinosynnema mirum DSM 43827]AXX32350.1 Oligopeptide ABC transporter, periplasmic oligopeptide-binding protein OppA [Actinosynnema pretiosum subsp. pretiosum]QUF03708.1 ABC transporter substrate-binding protein [Actinosynnema pretiosum subsp. pretiosum]